MAIPAIGRRAVHDRMSLFCHEKGALDALDLASIRSFGHHHALLLALLGNLSVASLVSFARVNSMKRRKLTGFPIVKLEHSDRMLSVLLSCRLKVGAPTT